MSRREIEYVGWRLRETLTELAALFERNDRRIRDCRTVLWIGHSAWRSARPAVFRPGLEVSGGPRLLTRRLP